MKIASLNRVGNSSSTQRGFLWSLNPLVTWMRLVGIQLDCSVNVSWWSRLMGLSLLAFNLALSITECSGAAKKASFSDDVLQVVGLLEQVNLAFYSAALHAAFMWTVRCDWNHLYRIMLKVERVFGSGHSDLYRKCRKVAIIGVAFFIVEVVVNVSSTLAYSILKGGKPVDAEDPTRQLFDPKTDEILIFFSRNIVMIAWSIQILFCILIRYVTIVFASLNRQMEVILGGDDSVALIGVKLENWRQKHVLACQMVDCINDCFGLVLLLSVGCYFFSLIILSYELYYYFMKYMSGVSVDYQPIITVMLATRHFVHFVLIIIMPYQMQNQAMDVTENLRQYKNSNEALRCRANGIVTMMREYESKSHSLQYKIDSLLNEINNYPPTITALQFFDIDAQLFVALFSTVLTYLVIIHQLSGEGNQQMTTMRP